MKLHLTKQASDKLSKINKEHYSYLLIWYDTEDCGCGVNGLPIPTLVHDKKPTEIELESESFPALVDRQQSIFFTKEMTLDFANETFRLSSPEGILNPFISPTRLIEGREDRS
ncbi:iron-sulfur cluster biosynthesis family protein [Ornithinibacillus gellani]|uniref:iron-sulfur cluster biosynthesis family protein n=1 Tax=Ornithinibacillus gellani TaxID=2293253 RepID=UPI000F49EE41|nr:iron-sulfur cluster biosynthesis family protein [Ornithinibacillus gellani]TQS74697.1 iron-sulfur cluster biosynthesis family protein [Ornithinibacillus gellani]